MKKAYKAPKTENFSVLSSSMLATSPFSGYGDGDQYARKRQRRSRNIWAGPQEGGRSAQLWDN